MSIQQLHPDLPDVLVGLGGSGREVVRMLLDREWVVESIVSADAARGLPACYIVDAERDRVLEDREIADGITRRLEEAVHRQDGEIQGEVGEVVSVLNIGKHLENEDIALDDLVRPRNAEAIVGETEVKTWWLSEDPTYIPTAFQNGTMRRRAFAKALPPTSEALTSHDPLDQIALGGPRANAALIAGLGGGFGSGVALDLARRMEEAGTDVTLFGILPGDGFGDVDGEYANAYAALSELEYLALTDNNPFENIVLFPTPGDLSDIQAFDEAIAYAVLAHSNLPPNDRMTLDESQAVGPTPYAPFTVAVPQILRFTTREMQQLREEMTMWMENRNQRLEAEIVVYRELATLLADAFPDVRGPVVAQGEDTPASHEEVPEDPIGDNNNHNFPPHDAFELVERVDALLETLDGDLFDRLNVDVAHDWYHAIEQVRENEDVNTDDDPHEVLAHLLNGLRHVLLEGPVQDEPDDPFAHHLHGTVQGELKAIILRSRILRAARRMDDEAFQESVLGAIDGDRYSAPPPALHDRAAELAHRLDHQQERLAAVEEIRDEVEEKIDHRIAEFREEALDAIETLVLIARNRHRIEELLKDLKELLHAFVDQVKHAPNKNELPEEPLESDLLDELDRLLGELGISPIDWKRLLESARAVVEAKAAWLDWQGDLLPRLFSDWPERYERAFERIDPELFDIPTADEAEREFYCRFVGDHIFERPHETIGTRRDQAIDTVIQAAERAVGTSDLYVADFRVSAEDSLGIEWSDIDDSWRTELHDFLSAISASHDSPSAGQVLGELCDSGGIVREAVEKALLPPVDLALNAVQEDVEATEADLDRTERLETIIEEEGREFAMCTGDSPFPAPGVDLNPSNSPDDYVRIESDAVAHLLHHDSLAETDHPDVLSAIEGFLDATVDPFQNLGDRVGLIAGNVVGEGNAGPIPYDGHRVIRAHFGTVFSNDSGDLPIDDALAGVANGVEAGGDCVGRRFGFGDPWEVAVVTFVGGVFLDNLSLITNARTAYEKSREAFGEQIRVHHAHGLDGRDQSLVEPGDDAGFVYRDKVLNVHDPAAIGSVVAADDHDAAEWILKECIATESFVGGPDSYSAEHAEES